MSQKLKEILRDLVTANHILHMHAAVDGFGHISVRHPDDPSIYIMAGYMPPALVTSTSDLIEYWVNDSSTVAPDAKKGYSERFIHGELFKLYQDIQCVVHSHAEAVIPYVVSDVPLVPVYHMAGFLGAGKVPIWDIAPLYAEGERQDMLVNNARFGASLAKAFSVPNDVKGVDGHASSPEGGKRNVVLMKRHGYTTHGKDIATAVYRAIYTLIDAGVQSTAMNISTAAFPTIDENETIKRLGMNERHSRDCQVMTEATQDKSWRLWCHEVEVNPIYQNEIAL